jgi:hypothetical protein
MIIPRSVFIRLRSIRVLAITGKADIDRAVPINIAKNNIPPLKCSPHKSGKKTTIQKPIINGIAMPIELAQAILTLLLLIIFRFISRPAANKKKRALRCFVWISP